MFENEASPRRYLIRKNRQCSQDPLEWLWVHLRWLALSIMESMPENLAMKLSETPQERKRLRAHSASGIVGSESKTTIDFDTLETWETVDE